MAGRRVHFVFPEELVLRVDARLGPGQSRGEFVRGAVERALSEAKEPPCRERSDPGFRSPGGEGGSAAPAEQPNDNPLTHHRPYRQHQAREFRPYPKGGG